MQEQMVRIRGEPTANPKVCRFVIGKVIYDGPLCVFNNAEEASGSPLAEKLFAIKSIVSLRISGDVVTVTKDGEVPWPDLGKEIGGAIRSHIDSGEIAVSEEFGKIRKSGLFAKIEAIIDEQINPQVASHGGVIKLEEVRDDNVYVTMGGGCQGCGMANATLKRGIETYIKHSFPEIKEVIDVTDHASGSNPYFESKQEGASPVADAKGGGCGPGCGCSTEQKAPVESKQSGCGSGCGCH
tara:strand:- start:952 stop:1671 length:720 start_codon:yes stop_codon:yes gene_type:complete